MFFLKKKILNLNTFFVFFIFFFSFLINSYYATIGVFPIDTFAHYDSGYRILNNQYPTREYWISSGIFIDFLESVFFKLMGVSWAAHLFHASIINGFISITFYFVLISLNLSKYYSLIYTLCFSILAYTISGTPFVDHHAAFLLLFGVFFIVLAIIKNNFFFWILAPWFLGFSLITKQVPAAYFIILLVSVFPLYFSFKKNFNIHFVIFFSTIFFILFFLFIIKKLNLDLDAIYLQYFLYPQTIGTDRLANLKSLKLSHFINHYKFILVPLLILLIITINYIYKNNILLKSKNTFIYVLIILYSLALLFHQILTKNQIYIYFLCPLLFSFANILLVNRKKINFFFLILSFFITLKLHFEYNEKRKFHDLRDVNLSKSNKAELIDNSLKGLNWITLSYKDSPSLEIKRLQNVMDYISKEKDPKMLITHYLFISSILKQNLHSPSKFYTLDGVSFPLKGNKYYRDYKIFFTNIVNKNKISSIYLIKNEGISDLVVYDYLDNNCFVKQENNDLIIFKILKKCSTNS